MDVDGDNDECLIRFDDRGRVYQFTESDFGRVEEYCDNECLGIQFLQSANVLRKLVAAVRELGVAAPYSLEELGSDRTRSALIESGEMQSIESLFGTDNLPQIARITAKQTYSFIHKE